MPAISVILPVYNRPQQLERALRSVLAQSQMDVEIIVVDDGSTDDLFATVPSLRQPRVRYLRQANQGVAQARNAGLAEAQGEFVGFLDSDDTLVPNGLELLHACLKKDPSAAIAHGWAVTVDEQGRPTQWTQPRLQGRCFEQFLFKNPTPMGTHLVRRDCLAKTAGFDPELPLLEDWDLWLRLSVRQAFTYVPAVVAHIFFQPVRRHTSQPAALVCEVVGKIYAKLQADAEARVLLKGRQWALHANQHVMAGHHYRVFEGDLRSARKEFLMALRIAPTFVPAYLGWLEALLGRQITDQLRAVRSGLYAARRGP